MTENRLRELLHDSVEEVPTVSLAERAWQAGVRRRRRNAAATGVAAAASVAVVLGGITLLDGGGEDAGGAPAGTPSPSASATASPTTPPTEGLEPDATHRGWDVFWSPTPGQERQMPWADSPLPRKVDLSSDAEELTAAPIDRALAAWAVVGEGNDLARVVVMAPDQSLRTIDVSGLAPLRDGGGNVSAPARSSMLSPDGTHLAFPQAGEVRVLALATGEWSTVDTGTATTEWLEWAATDLLWLPRNADRKDGPLFPLDGSGADLGGSAGSMQFTGAPGLGGSPYGRLVPGDAGSAFSLEGVAGLPVAEDEVTPSQVIVVDGTERRSALVLSASGSSGARQKQCCAAQAWWGSERLVYETREGGTATVWSWWVGSHEFARLSEISGADGSLVSSYADLQP